ncbi:UNVERIFIED_CONTAM: hypothetical protein NCL1_50624 [Trichonephila clavipes]
MPPSISGAEHVQPSQLQEDRDRRFVADQHRRGHRQCPGRMRQERAQHGLVRSGGHPWPHREWQGGALPGDAQAEEVGGRCDDFGAQHVVDERQTGFRVRCVIQQDHVLHPYRCPFSRDAVEQLAAIAIALRRLLCLVDTACPADDHADFAIGQIRDELRRVEVADVRANFHQQLFGLAIVSRILAVVG